MRTQTVLLWICLSLVVGLSACDWTSSSPVASLRRATGWPFEVVVVMDRDAWNGEVGELLQEQLRAPSRFASSGSIYACHLFGAIGLFRFITIRTKYLDRIRRS